MEVEAGYDLIFRAKSNGGIACEMFPGCWDVGI